MVNLFIKFIEWFLALILILAISFFLYYSFNQNYFAFIFFLAIIVVLVYFKIKTYSTIKKDDNLYKTSYLSCYLSEIVIIIVIFIMAALEIYKYGDVGNWFYFLLGATLLSRPFFFWLLKK